MKQVSSGGQAGAAPHVTSHKLERPRKLLLTALDAHILEMQSERIRSWGWSWIAPLHTDTQPNAPATSHPHPPRPSGCNLQEKSRKGPAQEHCSGFGAELSRPAAHQQSAAVDQDSRLQQPSAPGSCFDDGTSLDSDHDDSGQLAKAKLIAAAAHQMHRPAKRRRLAIPSQQQTRANIGSEQPIQQNKQASLGASAVGAKPIGSSGSCSDTIEAGSISLTHLACVLGTALDATELQVGAVSVLEYCPISKGAPGLRWSGCLTRPQD